MSSMQIMNTLDIRILPARVLHVLFSMHLCFLRLHCDFICYRRLESLVLVLGRGRQRSIIVSLIGSVWEQEKSRCSKGLIFCALEMWGGMHHLERSLLFDSS